MTSAEANRLVVISAIFTFGFGFANSFTESKGKFPTGAQVRLFIGTGIVYIVLTTLADTKPGLAGPFALTIMVTALITQAVPVVERLDFLTGIGADGEPKVRKIQRPALAPGSRGQMRPT